MAGASLKAHTRGNRQDRTKRNAARDKHGHRHDCCGTPGECRCAYRHSENTALSNRTNHSRRASRLISHMKIQPPNRRLGILISGRGSNFEAIASNTAAGLLEAEIAIVISNVESAAGLARAQQLGLKTALIPSRGKVREQFDSEVLHALRENNVGLIVLAG